MSRVRKTAKRTDSSLHNARPFFRQRALWIVDAISGMDCNRIAAIIRRLCRKHGIRLVVLDYLQKIKPASKQEKRTYEVGEVSGFSNRWPSKTGAAFLTLAQL